MVNTLKKFFFYFTYLLVHMVQVSGNQAWLRVCPVDDLTKDPQMDESSELGIKLGIADAELN